LEATKDAKIDGKEKRRTEKKNGKGEFWKRRRVRVAEKLTWCFLGAYADGLVVVR
jgi:hypothetical protein